MVHSLVRILASLRSRRDCSPTASGRPQRPTSEAESACVLQVAGRCRSRTSELSRQVLSQGKEPGPREGVPAQPQRARKTSTLESVLFAREGYRQLFYSWPCPFCLLRFAEGASAVGFLEVFAQRRTK